MRPCCQELISRQYLSVIDVSSFYFRLRPTNSFFLINNVLTLALVFSRPSIMCLVSHFFLFQSAARRVASGKSQAPAPSDRTVKQLLGELYEDKEYLEV